MTPRHSLAALALAFGAFAFVPAITENGHRASRGDQSAAVLFMALSTFAGALGAGSVVAIADGVKEAR